VAAAVEADDLVITVADDGVGIDAAVAVACGDGLPAPGQGLSSMRERAQLLGGALRVEALHPQGTVLTVSIPMRALG
jgi:signal transduction histidine kinase